MHTTAVEAHTVEATAARAGHGVGVRLSNIGKSFGGRRVLSGIDLELVPGEFVAVIGRSGCGKSTLLRTIAGLERADEGELVIGDDGVPNIRIMYQEARLLPWKTVLQNVALGLPDGARRAAAALSTVGLAERGSDWPTRLSGGQRQRVALARALVHQPDLLLLDEPLGALDALTRIEMQQLIESLWRQRGFTAVLVTHDVQEALVLADRVLLIENGQLALDEPITLVRDRRRGSAAFAALEERILARVLGRPLISAAPADAAP